MNWYLSVLKKYTVFSGRARRKEYWMFALFNMIFAFLAMILDNLLGTTTGDVNIGFLYTIYALAVFIPALAVAVRRLHDVGKSGWWFFIIFVPLVGSIWYIVLVVTDSQPGENEYGLNPKETV